jgi:hypothetical protein
MRRSRPREADYWSADDPRSFFAWRLPAFSGADVLSEHEMVALKALSDDHLVQLLVRVKSAERELRRLRATLESRWRLERRCPVCDKTVFGRSDRVYCSLTCKRSAYESRRVR